MYVMEEFNRNKKDRQYNNYRNVIDHDHYSGKCRDAAHNHDFHLITKEFAKNLAQI